MTWQSRVLAALCGIIAGLAAWTAPAISAPEPEIVMVSPPGGGTPMVAQLFRPPGAGPFPVVVFSHGRSPKQEERVGLKYPILTGHADYWTRKGFAVLAPFRPGYGPTGGVDRENSGARLNANNECIGRIDIAESLGHAAEALRGAVDWIRGQSWARRDAILLVGQSVGGATTVLAGSQNLPGVKGFINFSGGQAGWPDRRPGASCAPEQIEALFRQAGRRARLPSLWLYAENDVYWGAEAPRRWYEAFASGGSPSTFVMTPPVPDGDGHQLLAKGGRMWSSHVDPFVAKLGF